MAENVAGRAALWLPLRPGRDGPFWPLPLHVDIGRHRLFQGFQLRQAWLRPSLPFRLGLVEEVSGGTLKITTCGAFTTPCSAFLAEPNKPFCLFHVITPHN